MIATPPDDVPAQRLPPPVTREGDVTGLLRAWGAGDDDASHPLAQLVYDELRRQAGLTLRREDVGHTLQPTALVHEVWLRLDGQHRARWESRTQFFAVAARLMRHVLVDHARARRAGKRGGGGSHVSLEPSHDVAEDSAVDAVDLIALDDALARLATFDPFKARIVDLRYFGGLSIPEAADMLGVSVATLGREWAVARLWLRRELSA
jgi:RNA polymerase sigma factor (TIGR02999 family)